MRIIAATAAVHFVVGMGLGYIFTVKILLPAIGLSILGTFLWSLVIPFSIAWPIVIFVVVLQFGYVAGSLLFSRAAVRSEARSKDGITDSPHSPHGISAIWALRHRGH